MSSKLPDYNCYFLYKAPSKHKFIQTTKKKQIVRNFSPI